ncbi:MAG TPA: UPF0175 family protein [Terracidiphilus sp.]|nr:UPF0175 family protein [Terracidiphilus sp.]
MQVTVDIPDELARRLSESGEDLSRAALEALALEALALEGYRSERLTESQVREFLGFETRMQVHAFLKAHNCYLHYSIEDLEHDRQTAERLRAVRRSNPPARERLAG